MELETKVRKGDRSNGDRRRYGMNLKSQTETSANEYRNPKRDLQIDGRLVQGQRCNIRVSNRSTYTWVSGEVKINAGNNGSVQNKDSIQWVRTVHEVGRRWGLRKGCRALNAWAYWGPRVLRSLASRLPITVTNEWCRGELPITE